MSGTKVAYLFIFFSGVLIASGLKTFGDGFVKHFKALVECNGNDHCYGNQAVYRISYGTSLFFFLMMIFSGAIHKGWWCLKVPVYLALLIFSFFQSNDFYDVYVDITKGASAVFLLIQIMLLIDFAYHVHEYILEKIETGESDEDAKQALLPKDSESDSSVFTFTNFWRALYLIIGFGSVGFSIAMLIWMYYVYGGCTTGTVLVSITLSSTILFTILSVTIADIGLMPPSIISIYLTYLCWQSLSGHPNTTCNPYASELNSHGSVLSSILLASFTLTWTCWRTSSSVNAIFSSDEIEQEDSKKLKALLTGDSDEEAPLDEDIKRVQVNRTVSSSPKHDSTSGETTPNWQFHAIMLLGSMYMAMALTAWGATNGKSPNDSYKSSIVNVWVKIISEIGTIMLYAWTLMAPYCCPNRDFGR